MKKNKKTLKILRLLILILGIILIILITYSIYQRLRVNLFKKILEKSDLKNYELIQKDSSGETTIKSTDGVMLSENSESLIWVSEKENTRVVIDKKSKLALITKNPDTKLTVSSLNQSFIENYFEGKMHAKYLGKKDGFYKIQFTDKGSGVVTIIYINTETNYIEKVEQDFNKAKEITNYSIKANSVSENDVSYPDLTGYETGYSSSSNATDEDMEETKFDINNDVNTNSTNTLYNVVISH